MTSELRTGTAVDSRPRTTAISAHRGGAGLWPENSLTAFRGACELAVDTVELDVHPTADGRIVVHHDAELGRTVEGEGAVCAADWATLSRLRLKRSPQERMPLLEEVLDVLRPSHLGLRLEFKAGPDKVPYPGIVEAVHQRLVRHDMLARSFISSFEPAYLETVREIDDGLHRIWLIRPSLLETAGVEAIIAQATRLAIPEVDPRAETIQPDWPARFAAAGLRLGAYAANDRETMARMFAYGIAMFTTDRPDLALEVRRSL